MKRVPQSQRQLNLIGSYPTNIHRGFERHENIEMKSVNLVREELKADSMPPIRRARLPPTHSRARNPPVQGFHETTVEGYGDSSKATTLWKGMDVKYTPFVFQTGAASETKGIPRPPKTKFIPGVATGDRYGPPTPFVTPTADLPAGLRSAVVQRTAEGTPSCGSSSSAASTLPSNIPDPINNSAIGPPTCARTCCLSTEGSKLQSSANAALIAFRTLSLFILGYLLNVTNNYHLRLANTIALRQAE